MNSNKQLSRLMVFSVVASKKSFTRAAKYLNVSKSAISQQITLLESELGIRLVNRTTRGLSVTPVGEKVLKRCLILQDQVDLLFNDLKEAGEAPKGRISITYPYSLQSTVILPAIEQLCLEFPGLEPELIADDATRDVSDWLKCEFMQDHVGDSFTGVISTVTNFGMFVRLQDLHIEGLVHITSLGRDFYHFDDVRMCLTGENSGKKYRVGDEIQVQVAAVNLDEKKIDLRLEGVEPAGSGSAKGPSKGKNKGSSKGLSKGKSKGSSKTFSKGNGSSHSDSKSPDSKPAGKPKKNKKDKSKDKPKEKSKAKKRSARKKRPGKNARKKAKK